MEKKQLVSADPLDLALLAWSMVHGIAKLAITGRLPCQTAAVPIVTQPSLSLTLLHPPDKDRRSRTEEIMRAIVSGSTGLLGTNLVRTLHQAGHEVWALARSKEKARQLLGDMAARIIVGDIRIR